jgi:hypothetical protein
LGAARPALRRQQPSDAVKTVLALAIGLHLLAAQESYWRWPRRYCVSLILGGLPPLTSVDDWLRRLIGL